MTAVSADKVASLEPPRLPPVRGQDRHGHRQCLEESRRRREVLRRVAPLGDDEVRSVGSHL